MEKYDYTYDGSIEYCYPETDVLKNKLGIKDDNALTIAEREITSIKLLMLYNMPIMENIQKEKKLCGLNKSKFIERMAYYNGRRYYCRRQYV